MSIEIQTANSLGNIVSQFPLSAQIFENLGIDYCCGGSRTLQQAARDNQLDPVTLMTVLQAALNLGQAGMVTNTLNPSSLVTDALVEHIVAVHHAYIRDHMPRLLQLSAKVASAHGEKDARLVDFDTQLLVLGGTLMEHLAEEENDLFPIICKAAADQSKLNPALVDRLITDHDAVGAMMATLKALVNDYLIPDWACPTYRNLIQAFQEFELDLHRHIHLENNVLFPRLKAA